MSTIAVSKLIGSIILLVISIVVIVVSSIYMNAALNEENVSAKANPTYSNPWKGLYIITLTVGLGLFIMAIVGILKSANVGKLNEWMQTLKQAVEQRSLTPLRA